MLDENVKLIALIIFFLASDILFVIFKDLGHNKLDKEDYEDYSKFFGNSKKDDKDYKTKMNIIKKLINKDKLTDIKEIARLSSCDYYECIMKIKYLKKQKVIENYFIDMENGILNPCSEEDKKLIEKYSGFIYVKHLQPEYIARSMPNATFDNLAELKKQVLEELSYLDKKDLLNGINIDLVDEKIIYYDVEKLKKQKDYISINCPSCGALNNVPRKGKSKCEYCERILEEKSVIKN